MDKFRKRSYLPGDEHQINALYKLITGIERTAEEFHWEWIDTWDEKGDIWLGFDKTRKSNDQLILQYSLIPTPFSLWGVCFVAGKTENCMCHPDYRSAGIYFTHEKESFEKSKNRFQIFFTTSGNVSNGAVGAVRRKLGYVAFDSWINYLYCLDADTMQMWLSTKLSKKIKLHYSFIKILSQVVSRTASFYCSAFPRKKMNSEIKTIKKEQAPMIEIENLWGKNKALYGVTVDRTAKYLNWRINQNPYVNHEYVLYYKKKKLRGYIVFFCHNNIITIVDLLSDNKEVAILKEMVKVLIDYGQKNEIAIIRATATKNTRVLKTVFAHCGFINDSLISSIIMRFKTNLKSPFHVFIPKKIHREFLATGKDTLLPQNWYITSIVQEGSSPKP
ncbi:hypothetical protein [Desulfotignum balticum]|uniref:hypothetical protein n=1 Tax=Desulfotignum balticum TaxID=115781 RepID=UPI000413C7AE|nr:hypothetical protein [Desulfotignum balticum]